MICPKCKKENDENALVCNHCGFKLKLKCPYCNEYNTIGTKVCTSCGQKLLKVCPACKAINFAQADVCRKCQSPFEKESLNQPSQSQQMQIQQSISPKKVIESVPQQNLLEKSACVTLELINISSIKNNIKSDDLSKKIISKFYQIFLKAAKEYNLRALKINESTLVTSFNNAPSFIDSVNNSIKFVENLDRALDEVSEILNSKLKVSFKVRYLISTYKISQKQDILTAISLGVVDDIILSDEIYQKVKEKMPFKEIGDINDEKFYKFLDQNDPETIITDMPKEPYSKTRMEVVGELVNKVQMVPEGFIACLNGVTGIGKSNIFSALKMTFEEDNSNIWITGQCPLQGKHAPLALFRSMLKSLLDVPIVNIDIENTKTKISSYLTTNLNITDNDMINQILAIVFPDENKLQNTIYQNKQNTYNALATMLKSLLAKGAVVIQIEDIENIDSFSLEILRSLFDDGILKCNLKIFITSNIDVDMIQFFASSQLNKHNTYQVNYPLMTKAEIDDFIIKAIGVREELGANILNYIYEYSKNLPVFIEEFLYSLLQLGIIKFTNDNANPIYISPEISNFNFPKTVQEIVQLRLTNISNVKPNAFKTLYYASILGFKFLPAIVQNVLNISNEEYQEIIKYLSMNNFITPVDSYNYTFKSRMIWETIRNLPLSDDNKYTAVTSTMNTLVQLTMPDMAEVVENLESVNVPKYDMLSYIEQTSKEAYCLGDDYSYVYHKSMLLDAVDLSTIENKVTIGISLKEELLKITYVSFPDQAIKYAEDLYHHYSELDDAKTIDVLGVMSVAFENIGNYVAACECIDKALEKIDPAVNQIAAMLLYYSKLNATLQLGRYEEVINLAKNNVLPVIDLYNNNKTKEITTLSVEDIKLVELNTLYMISQAQALKGSPAAFDSAQKLYDEANAKVNMEYVLKSKFAKATILAFQGKLDEVQTILTETQEVVPSSKDPAGNTFTWLFLKNVCSLFRANYNDMNNELNMLANFSSNVKKFALEPVIRGFIVKLALHENNMDFAENLAYDLFYKCSNNQWALGALVNWYLYSEIAIFRENYDVALKVAQNALDVAEKANTNNIFFTALLKLKIAQVYSLRGDVDIAKINAEEALKLAFDNNYTYIKALYGIVIYDILLKQIQENPALKNDNINLLYKALLSSKEAVDELKNSELSVNLKQHIDNIFNFAKENNIDLV